MPYELESPLGSAVGFVGSLLAARQQRKDLDAQTARETAQQTFQNTLATKDLGLRTKQLSDVEAQTSRANRLEDLTRGTGQANQILKTRLAQMTQGLVAAAQHAVQTGKYDPAAFAQAVGHVAYTLTQRVKAEHPGVTDADLDVIGAIGSIVDPVTAAASAAQKQSLDIYKAQTGRITAENAGVGKAATAFRANEAGLLDAAKLKYFLNTGRMPSSATPGQLTGQQAVSDSDRTMTQFQQTYTRYATPSQAGDPALLSQQDFKGNAVTDPAAQNKALSVNMKIFAAARDTLDNSKNPMATARQMLRKNGTPSSSYLGNLILQYARAAQAQQRLQSGGSDAGPNPSQL